jgi:hypothetical protein
MFRQCRTTFATLYDGDPKDRQAILGHHSEQFTMRVYQKPIAARQQASVEELDSRADRQGCEDAQETRERMISSNSLQTPVERKEVNSSDIYASFYDRRAPCCSHVEPSLPRHAIWRLGSTSLLFG